MAGKQTRVLVDVVAAGSKGGKKRAEKLSPKRRKEIAAKAAAARWGKKSD